MCPMGRVAPQRNIGVLVSERGVSTEWTRPTDASPLLSWVQVSGRGLWCHVCEGPGWSPRETPPSTPTSAYRPSSRGQATAGNGQQLTVLRCHSQVYPAKGPSVAAVLQFLRNVERGSMQRPGIRDEGLHHSTASRCCATLGMLSAFSEPLSHSWDKETW